MSTTRSAIAIALLIIAAIGGFLLFRPTTDAPDGAKEGKTYRIGIIGGGTEFFGSIEPSFIESMADAGYVEGENTTYDVVHVGIVDEDEIRSTARRFVDEGVDLILSYPTEVTVVTKEVTEGTGIPVVFSFVILEGTDLIDSIERPGGNMTGVKYIGPDYALKRYEVMRQVAPDAKRYLVAHQIDYPAADGQVALLDGVAQDDGVEIVDVAVADLADLESKLAGLVHDGEPGVDAILTIIDPIGVVPETFSALATFAETYGLPIGGTYRNVNGHRSLFGVSGDIAYSGVQAADLAKIILSGTAPGTIPVTTIESYFVIDAKAFAAAGIEIDPNLLNQANDIISE